MKLKTAKGGNRRISHDYAKEISVFENFTDVLTINLPSNNISRFIVIIIEIILYI